MAKPETEYIDLLLDNHSICRIEHKGDYIDAVQESISNAIRRRDEWSVHNYDGTSATIEGIHVTHVNMNRVIARL